jgi:hypothetical protein
MIFGELAGDRSGKPPLELVLGMDDLDCANQHPRVSDCT